LYCSSILANSCHLLAGMECLIGGHTCCAFMSFSSVFIFHSEIFILIKFIYSDFYQTVVCQLQRFQTKYDREKSVSLLSQSLPYTILIQQAFTVSVIYVSSASLFLLLCFKISNWIRFWDLPIFLDEFISSIIFIFSFIYLSVIYDFQLLVNA